MKNNFLNEFRKNLVSGEWVLFSTGRKHSIRRFEDSYQPKEDCPFEDPIASGQEVIKFFPSASEWSAVLIKNKYPAVTHQACAALRTTGPYDVFDAVGFHELVVSRNHSRSFADMELSDIELIFKIFRDRYQEIAEDNCGQYVSIFHNFGREAGASIYHPHSQIISTPILPPQVARSIGGSENFFQTYREKVHDLLIEWELGQDKRIIEKNEKFVAFCPFASRHPYEMRIFPRISNPRFEEITDQEIPYLASILKSVLKRMSNILDRPPYNFFIHTAPVKQVGLVSGEFYHWHIEILPHIKIDAGFEIGTGIDINVVDPDEAAAELKNAH